MSAAITHYQLRTLTHAGVLLKLADAALSDFEAQLVAEVRARWLLLGRQATVTAAEWAVIETAIEAMTAWMAGRPSRATA